MKPCILIVDDEENLLLLFSRVLEGEGYKVVQAASFDRAMSLLPHHAFAGFVIDGLEGRGLPLAHAIRATGFTGSIVCLTGKQDTLEMMLQPAGPCTHGALKPIPLKPLRALFHEAFPLQQRSPA